MGVEIQLFECYALKALQKVRRKTNDVFIAFIVYVNYLKNAIQGVSGGIVNISGGGSMDYSQ